MHQGDRVEAGGIELVEKGDVSVVELWGEIDVALRNEASAALANALTRNLPIVLDAAGVTFIDSTGIAFIVQLFTIGAEDGLDVSLINPPANLTEVLEMLGVQELLTRGSRTAQA